MNTQSTIMKKQITMDIFNINYAGYAYFYWLSTEIQVWQLIQYNSLHKLIFDT